MPTMPSQDVNPRGVNGYTGALFPNQLGFYGSDFSNMKAGANAGLVVLARGQTNPGAGYPHTSPLPISPSPIPNVFHLGPHHRTETHSRHTPPPSTLPIPLSVSTVLPLPPPRSTPVPMSR
eukprot:3933600-Rhodomonas_salina.3